MSGRFDELTQVVRSAMERGVAVGVPSEDRELVHAAGITSVDHPLEVTDQTLFQVGSITKTITGTVVLQLVDEAILDPDTRRCGGTSRAFGSPTSRSPGRVTMRHLLTHSGGWVCDYFGDVGRGEDALRRMADAVAELPQLVPLGALWLRLGGRAHRRLGA